MSGGLSSGSTCCCVWAESGHVRLLHAASEDHAEEVISVAGTAAGGCRLAVKCHAEPSESAVSTECATYARFKGLGFTWPG